jgi:photosystem II stability/assembly factor-like uncharacterized protein
LSTCPQKNTRRSDDGGRTWYTPYVTWPDFRAASFPTRLRGFAFSGSRLLRTRDGGHTWNDSTPVVLPTQVPVHTPREAKSPCDPSWPAHASFVTPARGWILCGRTPNGYHHPVALFTTRDGGYRWTLVMDAGYRRLGRSSPGATCDCGWPGGVAFARGGRGLIWQSGGTFRTSDGGRTWSHVTFTVTDYVVGLSATQVSAATAYLLVHTVADERVDLRRTDDSGRTWRVVHVWHTQ